MSRFEEIATNLPKGFKQLAGVGFGAMTAVFSSLDGGLKVIVSEELHEDGFT